MADSDFTKIINDLNQTFQTNTKISDNKIEKMKLVLANLSLSTEDKAFANSQGKDLLAKAKDVEYAWNTLESLGLRKTLIQISDSTKDYSLAWWMNKEPLRSFPVGQGDSITAKALKIDFIAHETRDLSTYESLVSRDSDRLNAFISRTKTSGETANDGYEGFYTLQGDVGKRDMDRFNIGSTGFTVRLLMNPNARLGRDFTAQGGQIILLNKNAAKVLHEPLNMTVFEYFRAWEKGYDFGPQRKASRELLKRSFNADLENNPKKLKALLILVRKNMDNPRLMANWFSLPVSRNHPELMREYLSQSSVADIAIIIEASLSLEHWKNHPEFIEGLIAKNIRLIDDRLVRFVLSKKYWHHRSDLVEIIFDRVYDMRGDNKSEIIQHILSQNDASDRPEWKSWVERFIEEGKASGNTIHHMLETYLFSNKNLPLDPAWIDQVKEDKRIKRERERDLNACRMLFTYRSFRF